jgi:hypothetical protein
MATSSSIVLYLEDAMVPFKIVFSSSVVTARSWPFIGISKKVSSCAAIKRRKGVIARAKPEAISNLAKKEIASLFHSSQ